VTSFQFIALHMESSPVSDKRDKGAGINEAHGAFNPLLHRFEFFKPLL